MRFVALLLAAMSLPGQELSFRSIGPAFTSGRVNGFAVNPADSSSYYVAVASGGVWKTTNNGTTWTPVFDSQGSYSIGTVTLDPKNPSVVWVGTGENNNQRSVSYGDGVYRSDDAGRTWRNVGLKHSEHIARIVIDPRDSNVAYVAAPGPLWKGGGDRGLYKTTDGGKTWTSLIKVGEDTGVSDVVMDPRNPDILLAATHQRQRRYFTMIHGGPESALWRSTDAGKTWTKVAGGFPSGDLGRIGLATAPGNPNIIYAQVEAPEGKGGLHRSLDNGITWEKRNSYDQQGQYYSHVVVDPANSERVYIMGVNISVSDDGGKTLATLPSRNKHVDNHEIWIDPRKPSHYLVGCDGGIYESFDRGENWIFKSNLPVTQFYDVEVDQSTPFYNVYGGTQDNFSFGCPSRTKNANGITNADCFVTNGGDGFYQRVDPQDPNIVYASSQNGGFVRFDRRTGERTGIQPQPAKGDPPMRWNWDSPLVVSPQSHTRIYVGAQRLYRSDDRGDSWRAISPDLTRQLDRNKLPVMGKVWGVDAVQKHTSTALYGNISTLAESPKQDGLIYVGTDDGLLQITEDGGKNWRRVEKMAGAPEDGYVARVVASQHDANTVYVAFENHQNGDFKPYVLKSGDRGRTWTSISGNLPEVGSVYAFAEDHVDPKLLFAGTEFGAFYTTDGGEKWTRLSAGLPTIQVRDITIQRKQNDLVLGTFGRGIYILDDYSPLRTPATGDALYSVRAAQSYIPAWPLGTPNRGFQGETLYTAPNPPFGALITYILKEGVRTRKQERQEREKSDAKAPYATVEELRAEAEEEAPAVIVTISDAAGKPVRRLEGPATKGMHRVAWDLRGPTALLPSTTPVVMEEYRQPPAGPLMMPGKYTVTVAKRIGGVVAPLAVSQSFEVVGDTPSMREDRAQLAAFQEKVAKLQRSFTSADQALTEGRARLTAMRRAIDMTPALSLKVREQAVELDRRLGEIARVFRGDTVQRSRNEATAESISERIQTAAGAGRSSTGRPTPTAEATYRIAAEELAAELPKLKRILDIEIKALEKQLDTAGAPPTPGRWP